MSLVPQKLYNMSWEKSNYPFVPAIAVLDYAYYYGACKRELMLPR